VCAWCENVRGETGCWLPFGQYLPHDGTYAITSTICPACKSEFR